MVKVKLREDLALRFLDNGDCEVHGTRGFKMKALTALQIQLLKNIWNCGISPADEYTKEEGAVLKLLQTKKVLRLHRDDYSRNEIWLSHFTDDPHKAMRLLQLKKVLIVGCGGTGSIVADHLARAGLKNFFLMDGARLDAPDLNRQLPFQKTDIGQLKSDLLAKHLTGNLEAHTVIAIPQFLRADTDLSPILKEKQIDLIINCADTPKFEIEKLVLKLGLSRNAAVLMGSVGIEDYLVGKVLTGVAEIQSEIEKTEALQNRNFETRVVKGSICFLNTIASAKIAQTAYDYLMGL